MSGYAEIDLNNHIEDTLYLLLYQITDRLLWIEEVRIEIQNLHQ